MGRGPGFTVWLLALTGISLGCHSSPVDPLDWELSDGRLVSDLVDPERPTAVLVYDAHTCLYCSTPLTEWEALANADAIELVLLLAGEPSDADRRVLKIRRIPVTGFLDRDPGGSVPAEYVVREGSIAAQAQGQAAIRQQQLWTSIVRTTPSIDVEGP